MPVLLSLKSEGDVSASPNKSRIKTWELKPPLPTTCAGYPRIAYSFSCFIHLRKQPGKRFYASFLETCPLCLGGFDLGQLSSGAISVVSSDESSFIAALFEGVLLSNAAYLLLSLFQSPAAPRKPINNTSLFKYMCQKPTHSAYQAQGLNISS